MSKETTMSFRVEADLRADFHYAAGLDHRPAAQVLREFMRDYVQKVNSQVQTPKISASERKLREEAVNYAVASVGLEGFSVPDTYKAEAEKFINGEIEFDALTALVHQMAKDC